MKTDIWWAVLKHSQGAHTEDGATSARELR